MKKILIFCFFLFFSSCYRQHLYVQIENIDANYLASVHVKTPDYRKKKPPHGQRLIICWSFPEYLYEKKLSMNVTVRFWNNTQEIRKFKIHRRWGMKTFFFSNMEKDKKNNILTYKIDVLDEKGKVVEKWKHQFWTKLIDVDKD